MKTKTCDNPDRLWFNAFEKAGHAYIDPIMKNRFNVRYGGVGPETGITCESKNIRFDIDFNIVYPDISFKAMRSFGNLKFPAVRIFLQYPG